jgi:hypothetical protein
MTAFQLPEAHNGMTFDWFTVWGVGAAMVFAVMLLFILFFREKNREITQVAIGN